MTISIPPEGRQAIGGGARIEVGESPDDIQAARDQGVVGGMC